MYVKALELPDGIGGQLSRKLTAIAYASYHGYTYVHEPIKDLMWHPGDCFDPENRLDKQRIISRVNQLFPIPETILPADAEFEVAPVTMPSKQFSGTRGTFKKLPKQNKIVIHVRRGNIVADQSVNPRWVPDNIYRQMFIQLEKFIYDFGLDDYEIVILTDGPIDKPEYIPTPDLKFWKTQTGMNVDGEITKLEPFNTSILNPNLEFTIINNMCSIDSIELMLGAEWLIASYSAFSKMIALGGHYNAITNIRSSREHGDGYYIDLPGRVFKMVVGDKIYG